MPLDIFKKTFPLFAVDGKTLKENEPVHVIFGDGLNREDPITKVTGVIVQ